MSKAHFLVPRANWCCTTISLPIISSGRLGSKVGSNQKVVFEPKTGVKLRQINESLNGS